MSDPARPETSDARPDAPSDPLEVLMTKWRSTTSDVGVIGGKGVITFEAEVKCAKELEAAIPAHDAQVEARARLEEGQKWFEAMTHFQEPAELEIWAQNRLHDVREAAAPGPVSKESE